MPEYIVVQVESPLISEEHLSRAQACLSKVYTSTPSTNHLALLPREVRKRLRFKGRRRGGRCSIFLTEQWELYIYGRDVRDCLKEAKLVKECLRQCVGEVSFILITLEYELRQRGIAELLSMMGPIIIFLADRFITYPLHQLIALLLCLATVGLMLSFKALHVKVLVRLHIK